jgi:hypothetical protein
VQQNTLSSNQQTIDITAIRLSKQIVYVKGLENLILLSRRSKKSEQTRSIFKTEKYPNINTLKSLRNHLSTNVGFNNHGEIIVNCNHSLDIR